MISPEIKIFLYVIVNFSVGYLAATGRINASSKDILINQTTDIIGQVILLATSCVTLYKVFNHPHTSSNQLTVTQTDAGGQKTMDISQQISKEIEQTTVPPQIQHDIQTVLQQTGLPIRSNN